MRGVVTGALSPVSDSDGYDEDHQRRRVFGHLAAQLPKSSAAMMRSARVNDVDFLLCTLGGVSCKLRKAQPQLFFFIHRIIVGQRAKCFLVGNMAFWRYGVSGLIVLVYIFTIWL